MNGSCPVAFLAALISILKTLVSGKIIFNDDYSDPLSKTYSTG
jgi:hypothetical protein